jgi:hypothetical protein
MSVRLLSAHVLVGIVFVGSVTVAASAFPRYARLALAEVPVRGGDSRNPDLAVVRVLHRITRTYAFAALTVPVLGIVTAVQLHVLGQAWVMVSTALTAVAALVLALAVVPGQRRVLAGFDGDQEPSIGGSVLPRLAMVTGMFNLLWVTVVVLMILRPGSTTLVHP